MQLNRIWPAASPLMGFCLAPKTALISICSDCIKYVVKLPAYSVRRVF